MARLRRNETERASLAPRSCLWAMVVIVFALDLALPSTSLAETLSVERVGVAARAEIANRRYQREFPIPPKVEEETRRPPASGADRPVNRPRARPPDPRTPESTDDASRLVLWALIAIVCVLAVVFIANELPRFLRRRSGPRAALADGAAPDETDGRPVAGDMLHEADRLAREGAYGPAIHAMLLALIDALHGSIGRRLARSLTGREIVGAAGLAARSDAALTRIVAAAERSHFGGYHSNHADYETCRRDYAAVAADIGDRA